MADWKGPEKENNRKSVNLPNMLNSSIDRVLIVFKTDLLKIRNNFIFLHESDREHGDRRVIMREEE